MLYLLSLLRIKKNAKKLLAIERKSTFSVSDLKLWVEILEAGNIGCPCISLGYYEHTCPFTLLHCLNGRISEGCERGRLWSRFHFNKRIMKYFTKKLKEIYIKKKNDLSFL